MMAAVVIVVVGLAVDLATMVAALVIATARLYWHSRKYICLPHFVQPLHALAVQILVASIWHRASEPGAANVPHARWRRRWLRQVVVESGVRRLPCSVLLEFA